MLPSETYEVLVLEELIRSGRKADAFRFLREKTGCSPQQASEILAVMQSVLRSARAGENGASIDALAARRPSGRGRGASRPGDRAAGC